MPDNKFSDIISLVTSDFGMGIAKVAFPDVFRAGKSKTGRPRKVSLPDKLDKWMTVGKILMVVLGVVALRRKKAINQEQTVALVAYGTQKIKNLDVVNTFPSAPKWWLRNGLIEMGYPAESIPELSWDEMMVVLSDALVAWGEAHIRGQVVAALKAQGMDDATATKIYTMPLEQVQQMFAMMGVSGQASGVNNASQAQQAAQEGEAVRRPASVVRQNRRPDDRV